MSRTVEGTPKDRCDRQRSKRRERYEKPQIVDRGRLVEVALGGSPGSGDSGAGAFTEDPLS